jgi:hypothetical protein
MSTAAQEACDGLFERKYATFKNGRLPGSDAEIKAMEAFFSIKFVHISARLLKWRKLKQVVLPALNLGSHERGEVQADIENRIDGANLVSEVLELLVSDLAVKEDVELEALRICVEASDVVQDVLCAMVTQWTVDVLLCTAEKFTRVNSLELELMAKRRLCRSRAADEFASSIPASSAVPVSKFRLFFWLLERRLWDLFSAALRDSEHPVLVVPAAAPLPEADVHWLGPLLAYLAGWLLRQIDLALRSAVCPPNKTFWVAWRSSNSVTESEAEGVPLGMIKIESRGGLLLPSPELNDFVRHLECACSALLSEDAVLLRGQRHVREVQESIIASAHIRASFVATTKHARSLAAISGRRTEDDTTDLLRYAVEAWFRMRGPDFVVKTRKRHNIRISQQSKSVSLRAALAVAASAAPIAKPKRALSPPALAAEEAAPSSSNFDFLDDFLGSEDMALLVESFESDCSMPFERPEEPLDTAELDSNREFAENEEKFIAAGGSAMAMDGIRASYEEGEEEEEEEEE